MAPLGGMGSPTFMRSGPWGSVLTKGVRGGRMKSGCCVTLGKSPDVPGCQRSPAQGIQPSPPPALICVIYGSCRSAHAPSQGSRPDGGPHSGWQVTTRGEGKGRLVAWALLKWPLGNASAPEFTLAGWGMESQPWNNRPTDCFRTWHRQTSKDLAPWDPQEHRVQGRGCTLVGMPLPGPQMGVENCGEERQGGVSLFVLSRQQSHSGCRQGSCLSRRSGDWGPWGLRAQ